MRQKIIKNLVFTAIIAFILINGVFVLSASASNTDGAVDSIYKYAWGENIGWINFGTANGDVHITDSGLSGYALSENIGWINLNNVVNDGTGNLSGYAWGENVGWINFAPINGGVIINFSGEFTGSALGENIGWIIFDCDYQVKTDWRPRSTRSACNNSIDDDGDGLIDYPNDPGCESLIDNDEIDPTPSGGGGGLPPGASDPPALPDVTIENPQGNFSISINSGDEYTNSKTVVLKLNAGADTVNMSISNNADFENASIIPYQEEIFNFQFSISNEFSISNDQILTIYAKFYTKYGVASEVVSDSIIFGVEDIEKDIDILDVEDIEEKDTDILDIEDTKDTKKDIEDTGILDTEDTSWFHSPDRAVEPKMQDSEIQKPIEPDEPGIVDKITDKIIDIFKPDPELEPEIPIEELVVRETPVSMKGEWNLLSQKQINEFVLAPLPKGLERLAQKFPDLRKTFKEVGINKITDLEKLRNISLSLPGLTKSLGLEEKDLELVKNLPISEFSQEIKSRIPTEIIFAQIGGDKNIKNIDFNIKLSINEKGETRQKIRAISGKKLFLTIKPESKADSVIGYIAFKSKRSKDIGILDIDDIKNIKDIGILDIKNKLSLGFLVNSFVFAKPAFAEDYDSEIEEKFVTQKFAYADEDGDGIWTAEIYAPIVEGEYEIMTIIEYEDPELGTRMVKLTTVVDPEGYVYEKIKNQELRITNAVVSIYKLNSENSEYKLWQADNYSQKNPQTTDKTGRYSFLVPEGIYYITAESSNHSSYRSEPFTVQEGGGIHQNIELNAKNAWLKMFDWKVVAIFLLFVLVIFNFYKDRRKY